MTSCASNVVTTGTGLLMLHSTKPWLMSFSSHPVRRRRRFSPALGGRGGGDGG